VVEKQLEAGGIGVDPLLQSAKKHLHPSGQFFKPTGQIAQGEDDPPFIKRFFPGQREKLMQLLTDLQQCGCLEFARLLKNLMVEGNRLVRGFPPRSGELTKTTGAVKLFSGGNFRVILMRFKVAPLAKLCQNRIDLPLLIFHPCLSDDLVRTSSGRR